MPIDLGVSVQARSCLPQSGAPALEPVVGFLPVPALPYLDPVADVLAAPDLGRTHPLPVQATRQLFAVKDGASRLDVGAPDAGAHAIVGASTRTILRRSSSQGSSYRRLQVPGEVHVLMHITLALFHDRLLSDN